ncbi:hypothetical protein KL86DYS1_10016 [uncultured Dysgonomonas sp.]|uniref:Uncharacterized protein n=1 Tax=uncultured Dysgonomonas sp. TaxID=206096 RepID=A0A212IT71_9BACT|nr:hypothetical protein KL86DYS1_10016 [uncultured Dysgonomonas sp.]
MTAMFFQYSIEIRFKNQFRSLYNGSTLNNYDSFFFPINPMIGCLNFEAKKTKRLCEKNFI